MIGNHGAEAKVHNALEQMTDIEAEIEINEGGVEAPGIDAVNIANGVESLCEGGQEVAKQEEEGTKDGGEIEILSINLNESIALVFGIDIG